MSMSHHADIFAAPLGERKRYARRMRKKRSTRGATPPLFPGVGPVTEARLLGVEIKNRAALTKLGAIAAYRRIRFRYGKAVTLNALYGLEAVILGCHWRDLSPTRKAELKSAAASTAPDGEE
jgi:DNA transformation protein